MPSPLRTMPRARAHPSLVAHHSREEWKMQRRIMRRSTVRSGDDLLLDHVAIYR